MSFTKLFSSITDSTIWRETDTTRILWITMLAMADRDGLVSASVPGLADRARISMESAQIALKTLLSPDQWSRTKDFDGRRIEEVDGGWLLLNYEKYRAKASADEVREKTAARVARYRVRNAVKRTVTPVTQSNDIADAEAEAEALPKKVSSKPKTEPSDWAEPPLIEEIAARIIARHPHPLKMNLDEFVKGVLSKVQPNEFPEDVFTEIEKNHKTLCILDVENGGWLNASMKYKQIPALRDWVWRSRDEVSIPKPAIQAIANWVG